MAPGGLKDVEVRAWNEAPSATPGEVVIETFGCDLPPAFVASMAAAPAPPVWINLEYLSAEPYVERSHRLRSPQLAGPGAGLAKWFFYPGFTAATGGLIREPGLARARGEFQREAWLKARGIEARDEECLVSVFCYDSGLLPALAASLPEAPTLLLTPGIAPIPGIRCHALPYLGQPDYDRLLWSCDLNLVRGEDSFVRAQWAGAPFLWQIYPQQDGTQAAKLEAFHRRFQPSPDVAALSRAWNGLAPWPARMPPLAPWAARCRAWREELQSQTDLATQLLGFVAECS